MKKSISLPSSLLLVGCAVGACSSGDIGEEAWKIAETGAAISLPGLTPVPKGWDGSAVDLMVADAVASCSWQSNTKALEVGTTRDAYLSSVLGHMQTASCGNYADPNNGNLLGHWYLQRQDAACNKATPGVPTTVTLPKYVIPQQVTTATAGVPAGVAQATLDAASAILRAPSLNLCVAQLLREQAPGTASGEALLLSGDEQRLLLEVTRERAQLAMLGYAQLAVAFTEPDPGSIPATLPSTAPLPLVIKWGRDPANGNPISPTLENMGRDFAAAVQLHAIVSQELVEMFGRSASAGDLRGGHAATAAEETWSAGAFRQRALASLFGGDPLADEADGSAPWINPVGNHQPNVTVGGYGPLGWPERWEQPFFDVDMSRPEISRLLDLARQYDVLDAKVGNVVAVNCAGIDRAATATQLYLATEAALRNATCAQQSGGVCTTVTPASLPDPSVDYSSFLLWSVHGITPEHAGIAASYLAQLLEPVCTSTGMLHAGSGARNLARGSIGTPPAQSGLGSNWYHISRDARFVERGLMEIAPLYGQYTHFWMPTWLMPWASASRQGFGSWVNGNLGANTGDESRRLLGSSAALVATREALILADSRLYGMYPSPAHVGSYFVEKDRIMGVIGGSVGNVGVTIRPYVTTSANAANPGGVVSVSSFSGSYLWHCDVTMPADHPWWSAAGASFQVYAVSNDPIAGSLMTYPQTSIQGRTGGVGLLSGAALGTLSATWTTSTLDKNLRHYNGTMYVPAGVRRVTFIARRQIGASFEYAVLGSNVPIDPADSMQGYYMSPLGSLGVYADRLLRGQPGNPAKPAYDGFGFPTGWVPPTDPSLFGGFAGEDAATHYLSRAKQAAVEATAAVQTAFDNLLLQQSESAYAEAAQQRSAALVQDAKDTLCGSGNTSCDTSVSLGPVVDLAFAPTCPPPNPADTSAQLDCMAASMLTAARSSFLIANAVKGRLSDPKVPAFGAYGGGVLQARFIEQWGDVKQLRDAVNEVMDALVATKKHVAAFDTAMQNATESVSRNCSAKRMVEAVEAGTSVSVGVSVSAGFANASTSVSVTGSASPGPLVAQKQKCEDAMAALPSQQAQLVANLFDSVVALRSHAARVHDAARVLAASGADIQLQVENANRAKAQATLEAALTQKTQTTSFGLYRRYHSYDLWRAKAALEDARRYAVAARRAIEAKYLVDLSTMDAPEAFVAAPSSWADQVYDYDLSLPAAVGLSVGSEQASGIYPSKVLDLVGNLERFVEGYAVNRPSASMHGDVDVITLLGPEAVLVDPQSNGTGVGSTSQQHAWSFLCPEGEWVGLPTSGPSAGKADEACDGAKPARARLVFSLDPWGRVDANAAQSDPSKRYNVRWVGHALNLVGTGIKDCAKAADPLGCYASAFVPYDLSHVGPSWVADYAGAWHTLGVPVGQIEKAKALAAEQWLDPIVNGWSAPYVQAVVRQELAERPIDGTYVIELDVGPEVQLGRIERLQVLASTSYWVKQQ